MRKLAVIVLSISALAGCAVEPQNSNVYRSGEVGVAQDVRYATVEGVRNVTIDAGTTGVGMGTGAVVGGIAGSAIGRGTGSLLGAVVGVVGGGIAGQAIEKNTSQKNGVELTLRVRGGRQIVVVQPDNGTIFSIGSQVRVIGNGSNTRVSY